MTLTPFSLKVDLRKKGFNMFFKPYQLASIDLLIEHPEGLTSRQTWEKTNKTILGTISRASVINFLNDLVDLELIEYKETTGKGGIRRVYWLHKSKEELANVLSNKVKEALKTL